jgi:type II secretory pathway component PulJ
MKSRSCIKVKAFTVMEMLFVMMLSAIVTGLTYMYFNQFSYYLKKSAKSDNTYINYSLFSFAFNKDLDNAATLHFNGKDKITIGLIDEEITYQVEDKWIIRETENSSDTFKFKVSGLEVKEMEAHKQLVQSILFDAVFDTNSYLSYSYLKEYSSEILFKNYEPKQK